MFLVGSLRGQEAAYQLKPLEFPPVGSEHRVAGELVEADFIHRSGQFRADGSGDLVDFTMPPFATVLYLNSEADLRDVPLGTRLTFFLYQNEKGVLNRAASLRDDFSMLSREGMTYRVEAKIDGKLRVVKQHAGQQDDLGHHQLVVNAATRIWKDEKQITLDEIAAGDELLANLTGGKCADLWVGADAQKAATLQQRKTHQAFIKARGFAAWIDQVEGKKLTVTLLGDAQWLQWLFKEEGIEPEKWVKEHRTLGNAVANEELRTYNPPVDQQRSTVLEYQSVPTAEVFGCGGVRLVIQPNLLLEGHRKGHIVRLFKDGWPIKDMPVGESLYTEVPGALPLEESANQFPFRTDFANENLPWYQLKAGEFPPYRSEHRLGGELVKSDELHRSGQFRMDRTGELADFTMPPFGTVMRCDGEADLSDLPLGAHYIFYLHQDEKGAFTKASVIMDDFSQLASERCSYRVEELKLAEGKLVLARQLAMVKNAKDQLERPPAVGRGEFAVDDKTRVWKADSEIKLAELAVGDEVQCNLTGRTPTSRGRCLEIWVGAQTHKMAAQEQRARHVASLKKRGLPAWVDSVSGNEVTITFFSATRDGFDAQLEGDPYGKPLFVSLADDQLHATEKVEQVGFKTHLPEGNTAGTYGCSGCRWVFLAQKAPERYRPGQVVRVFKEGWTKGD